MILSMMADTFIIGKVRLFKVSQCTSVKTIGKLSYRYTRVGATSDYGLDGHVEIMLGSLVGR